MDFSEKCERQSKEDPRANLVGDGDTDLFKESFKKYRSWKKKGLTDDTEGVHSCSNDIIDIEGDRNKLNVIKELEISDLPMESCCQCGSSFFGLKPVSSWNVYQFTFPQGLIFIKNPFTSEGQQYWITRSLSDYHEKPYVTNIDNLCRISTDKKIDASAIKKDEEEFYKKLRWVTFGYHHDWDTKVYSDHYKCEFPPDLGSLTKYIALALDFRDFKAEAAIVNYYHLDSTLSGHVDRSEVNQKAPLFSLSFGQTAVFLIGGRTKDVKPVPVFLRSGDIVIMTGESRFSYHGVPCVLATKSLPWLNTDANSVCITDREADHGENGNELSSKRRKLDVTSPVLNCCSNCNQNSYIMHLCNPLVNKVLRRWSKFHSDYVSKCRINLNVRQVLFPGQNNLEVGIDKIHTKADSMQM